MRYITIEGGNAYIRIYNTEAAGAVSQLQHIHIASGCSGTSSAYQEISTITRNRAYLTKVERNTTGNTLRIYTIDEDVVPDMTGNEGKVLAVNGNGNGLVWKHVVTIYSGPTNPSSETGSDGDIYIKTTT